MTPKGLVDGPDPQEAHIVGHTLMVGIWEHGFWVVPIGVYHALKVFFRALFFAVGVTSGHLCVVTCHGVKHLTSSKVKISMKHLPCGLGSFIWVGLYHGVTMVL